jgi:lipoprotein-anchoring transpeptidase ErfK/SrfK
MLCVGAAAKGRFYCAAIVTASIAIGAASPATAATYYWNDSEPGLSRPERPTPHRHQKARHNPDKAARTAEREAAKPQGPLILAISINKQQVKIYDGNGLFTEAPVSTGMPGHATPLGVFSVIQKQKFHRSNIYSGAPMPFMQRITWSGVALHAGVLPGYPASHGCIRMPPGFAVKMYGWTRMGARVLVTPGELAPSSFEHPLLAAFKAEQPTAAAQPQPNAPAATKSDKGADVSKPLTVGSNLELRTTIGHDDGVQRVTDLASVPLRGQTHTADAGSATGGVITVSDAAPGPAAAVSRGEAAPEEPTKDETPTMPTTEPADKAESKSESKSDQAVADVPTKPGAPVSAAIPDKAEGKPADGEAVKLDDAAAVKAAATPAASTPKADATTPAKAIDDKPVTDRATADKPDDAAKAPDVKAPDVKAADVKPADAAKDPARLTDGDKPAPTKPELKRNSQVAIFISRKDSKLYVRQNFAPVFNTAITIAASDRPLGTHVFTAAADKAGSNAMHWSVISLPAPRSLARNADGERATRRGKKGGEAEVKAAPVPDSAAEALDRITIPADVMAWLGEALSSGSSLIVSDQGINQGETGEGTDFIVSLR